MTATPVRRACARPSLAPLAFAVACALALAGAGERAVAAPGAAHPQGTETWTVTNCDDAGPGSLRDVIGQFADSGDTIDMTALACSTITLATGAIQVTQDELYVLGPGAGQLAIDAGKASQVFVHAGEGAFLLNGITLRNGDVHSTDADARGGCIASQGLVSLMYAAVRDCSARVEGDFNASGGAVYARGGVYLGHSVVSGNRATASGAAQLRGFGVGGGVFTLGRGVFKYSTIEDNVAEGVEPARGQAGGAWVFGGGALMRSTIAGNRAGTCGGLLIMDAFYGDPIDIASSTISGNVADESGIGAGLYAGMTSELVVRNSTITGNVERNTAGERFGAGIRLGSGDPQLSLVSSIVSGNHLDDGSGLQPSDIGADGATSVVGERNLVGHSLIDLPPDTDARPPRLHPLADNGGPTPTHMPMNDSPAIDAGRDNGESRDQRGEGYARLLGIEADVGAVEWDPEGLEGDTIFANGFDLSSAD